MLQRLQRLQRNADKTNETNSTRHFANLASTNDNTEKELNVSTEKDSSCSKRNRSTPNVTPYNGFMSPPHILSPERPEPEFITPAKSDTSVCK